MRIGLLSLLFLGATLVGCVTTGSSSHQTARKASTPPPQEYIRHREEASVESGVVKRGEGRALWIQPSLEPGTIFTVRTRSSQTHANDTTESEEIIEYEVQKIDELGNITLLVRPKRYRMQGANFSFDSERDPLSEGSFAGSRIGQEYRVVMNSRGQCIEVPNGEELMVSWWMSDSIDRPAAERLATGMKQKGSRHWHAMFTPMIMLSMPEPLARGAEWRVSGATKSNWDVGDVSSDHWRSSYTLDSFDATNARITLDSVATVRSESPLSGGETYVGYMWNEADTTLKVDVETGLILESRGEATSGNSGPTRPRFRRVEEYELELGPAS